MENMTMEVNKPQMLCVFCGNDRFYTLQRVLEKVVVDSNNVIYSEDNTRIEAAVMKDIKPVCYNCEMEQEGFVTEEFFHLEICSDEYEDTIPAFVTPFNVQQYTKFVGRNATAATKDIAPSVLFIPSKVYDWNLQIHLARDENNLLEIRGKVITHDPADAEHVKVNENPDIVVHCPEDRGLLGRYWFERDGKKFSMYLLKSQFFMKDSSEFLA